jgi:CheY-like chemotaxis protein
VQFQLSRQPIRPKNRPGNTCNPGWFPTTASKTVLDPAHLHNKATGPRIRKVNDTVMNDHTKPRILIVEDDPDLRKILRLQLTTSGFDVNEAPNGAVGFALVQQEKPDCIILDLMMPVVDGFGFLKRVRSVKGLLTVPVLILTASDDERHKARGFQYQADAYMSKPYDLQTLTEQVCALCSCAVPEF